MRGPGGGGTWLRKMGLGMKRGSYIFGGREVMGMGEGTWSERGSDAEGDGITTYLHGTGRLTCH